MTVEIGGAGFIPGFTEQLEGMSPGESGTIDVTFPEDYQATELAGKAATFEITAKALQQAKSCRRSTTRWPRSSGFENAGGAARASITAPDAAGVRQMSRMRIKRELLDALAEQADFPVPESMVEAEFDADLAAGRGRPQGGQGWTRRTRARTRRRCKAEYRAIAERRVRLGLLLSEIGRVQRRSRSRRTR